tara:strand:- start:70349 stop:71224 length:876 start_codon:yes stop_codon:yes gene_type:complete
MDSMLPPAKKFLDALQTESPLQIVGTINAYSAILAKQAGFKAIYLSGAGVANASYGLPDLGITNLNNVLEDVRRITSAVDLPLLVDIDTGFGSILNVSNSVKEICKAGACGVHLEDQVNSKRCGHRDGKQLISTDEMCEKIQAAKLSIKDNLLDHDFIIMARTDAVANEGLDLAIARALHYIAAGANMIFAEAITSIKDYELFTSQVKVPVLANITEFGKTPLYSLDELKQAGIKMVLYPLSAFRAMNKAAFDVYEAIRKDGTQKDVVTIMETREELYNNLDYFSFENKLK